MYVINKPDNRLVVKSWCDYIDELTSKQLDNLCNHPILYHHVSLMADGHAGIGMPIGGVIAALGAVIPNSVGVDIGCGVRSIKTDIQNHEMTVEIIKETMDLVKDNIPVGEGKAYREEQEWIAFDSYLANFPTATENMPGWYNEKMWRLAKRNLGTLGGGKVIASRPSIKKY